MEEFLTTVAAKNSLQLVRRGVGWQLELPRRGDQLCRLDIGPDALDWYVNMENGNEQGKTFTDWMDYLGYDASTEQELIADKERDICWFIATWVEAEDVRVTPRKRGFLGIGGGYDAVWNHGGQWEEVQLCDPSR